MTWDVSGRLRPVRPGRPGAPLRPRDSSACPFLGELRRSEVTGQPPIDTGKVRRGTHPSEMTSSLYAVSPSTSGV